MTFEKPQTTHEERTADVSRSDIIKVRLSNIQQINNYVRIINLTLQDKTASVPFLPGQWLDVFVPGLERAGGFTITSTPSLARPVPPKRAASLQLAVQNTRNPPAEWLWKPIKEISNQELGVRVGGNFTWPPPHLDPQRIKRLVLIAGGVGINPLMSIFSHLMEIKYKGLDEIVFLYSTKADEQRPILGSRILFAMGVSRLCAKATTVKARFGMFLTGVTNEELQEARLLPEGAVNRRIGESDLQAALGDVSGREGTVCYVCGPPAMTDSFVEQLGSADGMHHDRVLCEKWW